MEEEAKESQGERNDLNLSAPGAEMLGSREVAKQIAKKAQFAGRPISREVAIPGLATSERENEVARQIAKRAGTSPDQVYKFHAVEKKATPELLNLVQSISLLIANCDLMPEEEYQKARAVVQSISLLIANCDSQLAIILSQIPQTDKRRENCRQRAQKTNYHRR